MENNNWSFNQIQQPGASSQPIAKTFLANVFSWMGIALAISAVTAYVFGTDSSYTQYLINLEGRPTGLGFLVMLLPLGFVLVMGTAFNKLSGMAMTALFLIFSVIMGMSLSTIFLAYTQTSIFQIFIISAAMFGFMGLVGYTTKTDLSKLGSILFMALIGIIVASIINIFIGSSPMAFVISLLTVIVFTGLTAYDVQKLKNIGAGVEYGTENTAKLSIMGALTLYLDFINLFLAMLRLFGDRK